MIYLLFGFLGGSITLFVYHLFIFNGRRKDLSNLSYALLNLTLGLLLFAREIYPRLPGFDMGLKVVLEITGMVLVAGTFSFFTHTIFLVRKLFLFNTVLYAVLFCAGVFLVVFFVLTGNGFVALRAIEIAVSVFALLLITPLVYFIIRMKKYRDRRIRQIIIGFLTALLLLVLYPVFRIFGVDLPPELSYGAVTVMVVLFSFALADSFNQEHKDLVDLKQNLEHKVKDRTDELLHVKNDAEEASRQKTMFFINLAHETKTPLTLITNYLDKYIKQAGMNADLSIIKQNIDKLRRDMVNFLDAEKLEKGQLFYNHNQVLDLSDLLGKKAVLFSEIARKKRISITGDVDRGIAVRADPFAIDRVINNLLDNAVKYTNADGAISVSLTERGGAAVMTVKDNGIGIPENVLQKVFEPYYQISHEKRSIQGIGMGLFITKKIIDSLQGSITVESEPGAGTQFTITLPVHAPSNGEEARQMDQYSMPMDVVPVFGKPGPREFVSGRPCILVVEDNMHLLTHLHSSLSERYNVFTAVNGRDALEVLKDIPKPDLILSDVQMDELDGFQFLEELGQDRHYRDIALIFITARTASDGRIKALSTGAIDYIHKPFSIEELVLKIESILRYQGLKKELYEKEKYASLGMLLGSVSHEILNPLSGITGPLENLQKILGEKGLAGEPAVGQFLEKIDRNSGRIKDIVMNLRILYYDRVLEMKEMEIRPVVESVISSFSEKLKKGVTVSNELPAGLRISANKNALMHIFTNLLSNALDAVDGNAADGESGRVRVYSSEEAGRAELAVADNGHGIKKDEINRIFDAFYTSKGIGKGTGLGLYIVKELVVKMGWEIKVASEPGKGTEFRLITG